MASLQRIQTALAAARLLALSSQVRVRGALLLFEYLVGQIWLQVSLLREIGRRCPCRLSSDLVVI